MLLLFVLKLSGDYFKRAGNPSKGLQTLLRPIIGHPKQLGMTRFPYSKNTLRRLTTGI